MFRCCHKEKKILKTNVKIYYREEYYHKTLATDIFLIEIFLSLQYFDLKL